MFATKKARLTEGNVGRTLVRLTIPMIFGIMSIVIFNLADTYFVGKLGTNELAALSFTFPVVMVIASIALGLGIGASAVISRAIGEGNHHKVQRLTTDSLVLSVLLVAVFVIFGFFTIDPLFRLLGASGEILSLIKQYMTIWYSGVLFVVVPMVGNNAIRAGGDMKTPSLIMIIGAGTNIILDPFLIFGIGPFPRLEIAGAAIATVLARAFIFFVSIFVLHFREKMLTFDLSAAKTTLKSWGEILYVGVPTATTRVMIPLAVGIVTRLVASYGAAAVAAFGVATRVEFFSLTVIAALSSVLAPFVGQNWGARIFERVKLGIKLSSRFAMAWGISMFALLALFARPIASIFSDNPLVISNTVRYLMIVPIGYAFEGLLFLATSALNVLHKPIHSSALTLGQMFLLYVPLSFAGSYFFGIPGIFVGIALSYVLTGIAGYFVLDKVLSKK
jgi:putative MATE family efflux protein